MVAHTLVMALRQVILRLQGQPELHSEFLTNLGYSFKTLSQKDRKEVKWLGEVNKPYTQNFGHGWIKGPCHANWSPTLTFA